jgi:hypothetical protein
MVQECLVSSLSSVLPHASKSFTSGRLSYSYWQRFSLDLDFLLLDAYSVFSQLPCQLWQQSVYLTMAD